MGPRFRAGGQQKRAETTAIELAMLKSIYFTVASPRGPLKVFQIGRRLVLLGGHQVPVGAEEISIAADLDVLIVLGTDMLAPDRPRATRAPIVLGDRPRPREGIVDHRDLVVQNAGL